VSLHNNLLRWHAGAIPAEAGEECATSALERGRDWGTERPALILEGKVSKWLNLGAKTYLITYGKLLRSGGSKSSDEKRQGVLRIFAVARCSNCVQQ
jgi:hypothetical protein